MPKNKKTKAVIFERNTARSNSNVFMIIAFGMTLIMVLATGQWLLTIFALVAFVFVIYRVIKIKDLPFAELEGNSLVLRPQPFWGQKLINLEDVESVSIDDDFNRTIILVFKESADFRCHGWNLKSEDDKRFVKEITKRIKV